MAFGSSRLWLGAGQLQVLPESCEEVLPDGAAQRPAELLANWDLEVSHQIKKKSCCFYMLPL